jgi:hypothetical protein
MRAATPSPLVITIAKIVLEETHETYMPATPPVGLRFRNCARARPGHGPLTDFYRYQTHLDNL